MSLYDPVKTASTKYLFFTGKGGVGKTSIACATAVALVDAGEKILLVSTDPASNLQDVFGVSLNDAGVAIAEVPGLVVANLDPLTAAAEYRESVIGAYRGKLPDSAIQNVEEQLSGSCTVEIAAFNAFSEFLTNAEKAEKFDHIIFDTAPTGHTLRMLQLPSAWSGFISESKHGASCLGQLSGLEDKKEMYKKAVHTLADSRLTTLILVTRPETAPIREAQRASHELEALEIRNQVLVINGLLETYDVNDAVETALFKKQQSALQEIPHNLVKQSVTMVPLRAYNITGLDNVRQLLSYSGYTTAVATLQRPDAYALSDVVDEIEASNKKVIFTMGKGGVGKTTIAAAIALGLHRKGRKVRLATTDPADHLNLVIGQQEGISVSHIDEKGELRKYQEEVLTKARQTMPEDDLEYVKEDLRSPCTQEIAVFRAFADIVAKSRDEIVVLDTAPTGHTILLLESTQNYNQQIENSGGAVSDAEKDLLPRLKDSNETEVIIVTLAETTPFYEAKRLLDDLKRAGLAVRWWVINASYSMADTKSDFLRAKATAELQWIHEVDNISDGQYAIIPWKPFEVKGNKLLELL
ncbi:arsenic ABC transporter ATPase [Megasphaera cerevisiae DSM 20462]|uniref:Arsenic ABC transporter ATPase n=1 Tax=Megasphaera cerevisiae DSM 20462 TaxID=1122219 RepID=A0A0J6WSB4_9FIRM|nr:arsenic ABC transporter ATPase [Megasphaera cerevisiae DSM 20462]OKY53241.1 arsenical pump-driving ATPase [Megasphaera cerevisiae]